MDDVIVNTFFFYQINEESQNVIRTSVTHLAAPCLPLLFLTTRLRHLCSIS